MTDSLNLRFDDRFSKRLPADPIEENYRRQVPGACFSYVAPTPVTSPHLVSHVKEVSQLLGLADGDEASEEFVQVFSGNKLLADMKPYAMCYGGHQFGNWAGQLGDGRAINLGEIKNSQGEHWAIQLKGSGATPYSRTADGLAVLRSSVREFLCSEAMFHLGVPTTRALSLITTGEDVVRDMFYDGRPQKEPGAIVCRVAPSFLRFGSYQIFASRDELDELRILANYTIEHHFAHLLLEHEANTKEVFLAWFSEVCDLTLEMIIHWLRVGFVHGVMNTDNLSIHGLTIDYGPYGWLDDFNPNWTPNTTDEQNKRYRYGQQANIALWNLYQLANSLYPLIEDSDALESILKNYNESYQTKALAMWASKLGIQNATKEDQALVDALLALLGEQETDMTIFFRTLSSQKVPNYQSVADSFYQLEMHDEDYQARFSVWFDQYNARLEENSYSHSERKSSMNKVNPKYVFRNYLAQQAIDKAHLGDYSMIDELLELFRHPYDEQPDKAHYAVKRPDWARTKAGCSMLSCSS